MKIEIDTSKYSREEWLIGIFLCVFLYRGIITQFNFSDMLLTGLALLGVGWVFIWLFDELDKKKGIDIEEVTDENGFDWNIVIRVFVAIIAIWIGYYILSLMIPYFAYTYEIYWYPYRESILMVFLLIGTAVLIVGLKTLYTLIKPYMQEDDKSAS